MRTRLFIATLATFAVAVMPAAHAGVIAPSTAVQSSALSLSLTQQVRRVCTSVPRCDLHNGCFMQQQCEVTADYPPEHRTMARAQRRRDPDGDGAPAAQQPMQQSEPAGGGEPEQQK